MGKKYYQDNHKKAKDLNTRLGGNQQGGFDAELDTSGRDGIVLGPIVGAFGEMPSHVDLLSDAIANALTAEHLSYYGDRGSKSVKAYYRRVLYESYVNPEPGFQSGPGGSVDAN